jgi:hypothetical protein
MPALVYNQNLEKGATFKRTFKWVYADGSDRNLNGWRGHMQVRPGYGLPITLNLTTENQGVTFLDSFFTILIDVSLHNNFITPIIDPKQTPKATYYYDLFLFDPNNVSKKFMKGNIYVTGSITDDN